MASFPGQPKQADAGNAKPVWISTKQQMMGRRWHQLDHTQINCTSLQTDNHASTSSLSFLQDGCSSWCPTNSIKALKARMPGKKLEVVETFEYRWTCGELSPFSSWRCPSWSRWCPFHERSHPASYVTETIKRMSYLYWERFEPGYTTSSRILIKQQMPCQNYSPLHIMVATIKSTSHMPQNLQSVKCVTTTIKPRSHLLSPPTLSKAHTTLDRKMWRDSVKETHFKAHLIIMTIIMTTTVIIITTR